MLSFIFILCCCGPEVPRFPTELHHIFLLRLRWKCATSVNSQQMKTFLLFVLLLKLPGLLMALPGNCSNMTNEELILQQLTAINVRMDLMTDRMDLMNNKINDRMDLMNDKINAKIDLMNDQFNDRMDMLAKQIVESEQRVRKAIHDYNTDTVSALASATTPSVVCRSMLTAHFVVYDDLLFGISVAHTPCYYSDEIPNYIEACPELDVSLWTGCPPQGTALLNITGSIVTAKLGDVATVFGFAKSQPRTWKGSIVGHVTTNVSGRHFTHDAFEREGELLFQEVQDLGMSGGGAVNGKGEYFWQIKF